MKRRDELANMATIREYFSIARLILILYISTYANKPITQALKPCTQVQAKSLSPLQWTTEYAYINPFQRV
jgi:hypothetical protein